MLRTSNPSLPTSGCIHSELSAVTVTLLLHSYSHISDSGKASMSNRVFFKSPLHFALKKKKNTLMFRIRLVFE